MPEDQLQPFVDTLNFYTSFFFMLIVVCFIIFIILLVVLIKNDKAKKHLIRNKSFLSETISVQEEERHRISQELHDSVSQNIKALLLLQKECLELTDSLQEEAKNNPKAYSDTQALQTQIQKIVALEKQNQKQLRNIIQNLTIPELKGMPFKTVLTDYCELFSKQNSIPCNYFIDSSVNLEEFSIDAKHHILRIIQEALQNAKLHANPKETSVIIRRHENKIRIMIFDDGCGIDSSDSTASSNYSNSPLHFGMSGMEMRTNLLNGTLSITSSPESGTEVCVEIPE